jgi:hypothetical protein
MYMRPDNRFKTLDDIVKASPPPKCGAIGTTSTAFNIPKLLDQTIGTNFEIILGYKRARTSTSLWKETKSSAVLSLLRCFLPGSRFLPG